MNFSAFYFYLIFLHFTLFFSFILLFFLSFLSWINPYNPLKYFVNRLSLTWPSVISQAHIPTLTSLFKRTRNCKTLTLLYLSWKDSRVRTISKIFKYPNNNLNTMAKSYWNSLMPNAILDHRAPNRNKFSLLAGRSL